MCLQAHDSLEAAPPDQLHALGKVSVESSEAEEDTPSDEMIDADTRSKMVLLGGLSRRSDKQEHEHAKRASHSKRVYRSQGGLISFLDYFVLRTSLPDM
jgi:hypothetical protein